MLIFFAGMIKRHKLEGTSWVTAPSVAGRGFQPLSTTRDVVIDGVLFESSRSSLVRKDRKSSSCRLHVTGANPAVKLFASLSVPKPAGTSVNPPPGWRAQEYTTKKVTGHRIPAGRTYKPKVSPRTRQPRTHNMTLDNTRTQLRYYSRSVQNLDLINSSRKRRSQKRMKYVDKPCPRFTTTGELPLALPSLTTILQRYIQVHVAVALHASISTIPTRLRFVGTSCMATVPTLPKAAIFPTTQRLSVPHFVSISQTMDDAPGRAVLFPMFVWVSGTVFVVTSLSLDTVPEVLIVKCNMSGNVQTLQKKETAQQKDVSFPMLFVQIAIAKHQHRYQRYRPWRAPLPQFQSHLLPLLPVLQPLLIFRLTLGQRQV